MREILFRAKRKDNGEWVYGLPFKTYSTFYRDYIWTIQHLNKFEIPIAHYDIIPETIGQSTGMWDKNKTTIFEGDIVNFGINQRPMYVHFNEETLTWELTDVGVPACEVNHLSNTFELGEIQIESAYGEMFSEIVGNIYDGGNK